MEQIKGRILELLDNQKALLYKNLTFYVIDFHNGNLSEVVRLPVSSIKKILSHFRWTDRLLRIEPRCSVRISNSEILISMLHKIWLLDISNKTIVPVYEGRDRFSDCLNFCKFEGRVYWGDYGANIIHESINIYQYDVAEREVTIVYTFPAGDVMHIHNIFLNEKNTHFWIFAGDNEEKAGIYSANLDWSQVTPYMVGEQRFRAVVGFPYKKGLLYATDSVETENHLRIIDIRGVERDLCSINGSCIYGCETHNYYLFSTTVEPHEGVGFWRRFDERLGGGIKSRDVHLIAVSKKNLTVRVVRIYPKDCLPMVLFQYGRLRFAGGQQDSESVWCSPVACKKYDGMSVRLRLMSF